MLCLFRDKYTKISDFTEFSLLPSPRKQLTRPKLLVMLLTFKILSFKVLNSPLCLNGFVLGIREPLLQFLKVIYTMVGLYKL